MEILSPASDPSLPDPTAAELAQVKAGTLLEPGTDFENQWGWLRTGTPEQRAFYNQKKAERQMALETLYGLRPDMAQRQAEIDQETT